ncbi:MAG: hypothetical protein FJX77_14355, partial [Armatimonadetes bacterium]|nr:hypothetical protein [Armatimonadota bacterium]
MTLSDPIKVLLRVTGVLEKLDVPYLAGGSIASSYYGMARPTQDVDVVAALTLDHVERFVAELGADFYVDAAMIREAIRNRGSFNVILLETMDKADLFLMSPTPWCREEMLRRRREFPDPE